jgi:hypothetical protein
VTHTHEWLTAKASSPDSLFDELGDCYLKNRDLSSLTVQTVTSVAGC